MTRIGILDDEIIICETLVSYLAEMGYHDPQYALEYDEAVKMMQHFKPDLLLVDINLGGKKSGIDFARYIRQQHNMPLIFVSSYSDKSTIGTAMEVQPDGYLVKPFTRENLYAAIETALAGFSGKKGTEEYRLLTDALFVKQDALFVKVYFRDIRYIKSDGVYAEIFTSDRRFLIRETLKNLLLTLPAEMFFQLHRSYIVNVQGIDAVNSEYVLIGKEHIPISRTNREEFLRKLKIV